MGRPEAAITEFTDSANEHVRRLSLSTVFEKCQRKFSKCSVTNLAYWKSHKIQTRIKQMAK